MGFLQDVNKTVASMQLALVIMILKGLSIKHQS